MKLKIFVTYFPTAKRPLSAYLSYKHALQSPEVVSAGYLVAPVSLEDYDVDFDDSSLLKVQFENFINLKSENLKSDE